MYIEEVAHSTPEKIVTITVDPAEGFQPHHGRSVAFALKLKGDLNKQAQDVTKKHYEAFAALDMSMLEVTPLYATTDGKLLVLDEELIFVSNSIYRHPEFVALRHESEEDAMEV